MPQHHLVASPRRRTLLLGSLAAPALVLGGCCTMGGGFPGPEIDGEIPDGLRPILAPGPARKAPGAPARVIDVHGHFFNARDVPVAGYLRGPVAHNKGGLLGQLIEALADVADWLAASAPSAKAEWDELIRRAQAPAKHSPEALASDLDAEREAYLRDVSKRFHAEITRRSPAFLSTFDALQAQARQRPSARAAETRTFNPDSLFDAMQRAETREGPTVQAYGDEDPPPYAEGVLAFAGHMLSYRWMNLRTFQRAYTIEEGSFGVDTVLGALVDFDHWLTPPPPRTAQMDQIKLHQLLSQLSGGYMRPLAAYNPWQDVKNGGATRERVLQAIRARGFIGAKIYPPNGYRPYGNQQAPLPPHRRPTGMPPEEQLDEALLALWQACTPLGAPVMAHSGHSMGSNDDLEAMAGPPGYRMLTSKMGVHQPARVHLGHFGGDAGQFPWTSDFAHLMARPEGAAIYGDIAYWDGLRCPRGPARCPAVDRLKAALTAHPSVAKRLMYGSDWLMLSQERRWDRYPADVLAAVRDAQVDVAAVFGGNALACFPRLGTAG
jgi:predicted TIM-barrel fold metal-dependent hydrolase